MEGHALYLGGEYAKALQSFERYAAGGGGEGTEDRGRALACAALCCLSLGLHRRGLKFCADAASCAGDAPLVADIVRCSFLLSFILFCSL